jgi:hypothetical protein
MSRHEPLHNGTTMINIYNITCELYLEVLCYKHVTETYRPSTLHRYSNSSTIELKNIYIEYTKLKSFSSYFIWHSSSYVEHK